MAVRIVLWVIQGYVALNALLRAYVLITMPGPMAAQVSHMPGPLRYVAAGLYVVLGLGLVAPDLLKRRGAVEAAMAITVLSAAEAVAALVSGLMMGAMARLFIVAAMIVFILLRRRPSTAAA